MINTPLTAEALAWACDRFEDFYLVQKGGEWADMIEALSVLRNSLGVDDEMVDLLTTWVKEFLEDTGYAPPLLLGLMVGLIAADRQRELES